MNNVFDKLGETVTNIASMVGNKSVELMNWGKLKVDKLNLESQIRHKKTKIGDLVYAAYAANDTSENNDIVSLCEEVTLLLEQLRDVEAKMEEMRKAGMEPPDEAESGTKITITPDEIITPDEVIRPNDSQE